MPGSEREYLRDRTFEGARGRFDARPRRWGGTAVPPQRRSVSCGPTVVTCRSRSFEAGAAVRLRPSSRRERPTPMIEARDLTKRYGEKTVVDHLSFTIRP